MKMMVAVAALIVLAAGCRDDCVPPPCPAQRALDLTVASAGGPGAVVIPGLTISVSGPSGATPCSFASSVDPTYCVVGGSRGTYQVTVSAPGFKPVQQTVHVTSSGMQGPCTCDIPNIQHLSFILAPA